ncbi:MAG TPA: hypothetical protein VIX38_06130 [Nitrososphaeraceae archaeon]
MIQTKSIFGYVMTAAVVMVVAGIAALISANAHSQNMTTPPTSQQQDQTTEGWMSSFNLEKCDFVSTGENKYFILKPGYQVTLEGEEDGEELKLVMTVLNETKIVNGIETRVVEEKETEGGNLVEISRNYFALCKPTNNAIYFGEDVDIYENGKKVSQEGAWLAGQNNSKAGMIMPGRVEVGLKYYQEIAPGVAEDRAKIVSVNGSMDTPAGTFDQVLKTEETNPLKPEEKELKFYAPGIGLIQEEAIKLVNYTKP